MQSNSDERHEQVNESAHAPEPRTHREARPGTRRSRPPVLDEARSVPVSVEPRTALWTHATPPVALGDAQLRERTRAAVAALFGAPETRGFAVRYWDGTLEQPIVADAPPPAFTLVIRSRFPPFTDIR